MSSPVVVQGYVVEDNVPSAPAQAQMFGAGLTCRKCHAVSQNDMKFCGQCGEQIGPVACPQCGADVPEGNTFCGKCGALTSGGPQSVVPPGSTPAVTGNGGYWTEYTNIDMCGQGDVEIVPSWRSHTTIEALKRKVEERGLSAITVSSGQPSFGHAALKQFPYQLTQDHCKPITTCCHHPCTIYIYTPPAGPQRGAQPAASSANGLISTNDIQGCWACLCVPGGCAIFKKIAQGPDRLLHQGVVFLFFGIPCPFSEPRVRHPGSNGFYKEGEPGNVDVYQSSRCVCNGIACSCKLC